MILGFKDKRLKELYHSGNKKGLNQAHLKKIRHILAFLDVAAKPDDLNIPGFRLHPLSGDMKEYWSVTVAANWRIIFQFQGNDIINVELIDYH